MSKDFFRVSLVFYMEPGVTYKPLPEIPWDYQQKQHGLFQVILRTQGESESTVRAWIDTYKFIYGECWETYVK